VLNVVTLPPDSTWEGRVGAAEVAAWYTSVGVPEVSTYTPDAPHPYMQRTGTIDFVIVLEGEPTLVLDTDEVTLKQGEIVIQRGVNHAWANRSGSPAVLAVASHDAGE
jgi:hypothetical protein